MEIERGQVFNLWDTNGRRHDIINAINIYLHILQYLFQRYPTEKWAAYPNSTLQYHFYKAAINASPEVFQSHQRFDDFEQFLSDKYLSFINKKLQLSIDDKKNLDTNIEKRARHYTSNLVKLGFADKERRISEAGACFIRNSVQRDDIEKLLPITDTNLILLRQLLKLKIYTKPDDNGNRSFYSPCLMALYILLNNDGIDVNDFKNKIQGLSPYWHNDVSLINSGNINLCDLIMTDINIPEFFVQSAKISEEVFSSYIKNQKSNTVVPIYYTFYSTLYDYVYSPTEANYIILRDLLLGVENTKIEKAFGLGADIFKIGNKVRPYTHERFKEENADNALLTDQINAELYKKYCISKYIDTAKEYSDTTVRMLGATGLFQFSKPLVELSYKELINVIFTHYDLTQDIFGVVSQQDYYNQEEDSQSTFYKETSIIEIFNLDSKKVNDILSDLHILYGKDNDIRSVLKEANKHKFEQHIEEKYSKETIVELLKMFSDRKNDSKIQEIVNKEATVPTIYEFVVAIAWYYISNKTISVYDSLNLTLNGDFEPVIHAGGGTGDIVVEYPNKVVMLEATLMNASAQKRGEWEPVLRHAINLTAESYPQKVYTLFVADTLDYNTINIWRAVAAVKLKSSTTGKKTEHVVIMPFTNEHICHFIESNICDDAIITAIDHSYDEIKANFDETWHEKILATI